MSNTLGHTYLAIVLVFWSVASFAGDKAPVKVEIIGETTLSKDEIYKSTLLWMAESFRSSEKVIDLKDQDIGVIVGNGSVDVKIGWGVYAPALFKLKIDIKESRYRLTFKDVRIDFDGNVKPIESANRKSLEPKVTKSFQDIAASLNKYLSEVKSNDDW